MMPASIVDELPRPASNYINHVIHILNKYISSTDYSLFLFGSLSLKQDKPNIEKGTSDVDIIVVVKDDMIHQARLSWPELSAVQHFYFDTKEKRWNLVIAVLRALERQTGMHESIFLVSEQDFCNVRFPRIFSTNRILSWLLAPRYLVLGSALCHLKLVSGQILDDKTVQAIDSITRKKARTNTELFKSMIMNVLISMGAMCLLPLTTLATKYAVESIKWSMYATTYVITGSRPSKTKQNRFFKRLGIPGSFLDRWANISNHYKPDMKFTIAAAWNVLKIHILGFKIHRT